MKIRCAHDKMVPVDALQFHPKNRNKHPKDQIARLAQILEYQGWRYPVKVSLLSGYVTSGHGRIEAARHNGWAEVPVNYQEYESEEQEYADVQADNAIASWAELDLTGINADVIELGPDFDIDLLGIKDFVLDPADKDKDADETPEPPKEAKSKYGELWLLGKHRVLCGDSTSGDDYLKLMDGHVPDMVFTDPPYGLGGYGGRRNLPLQGDDQNCARFYDCIPTDVPEVYVWGLFWTLPLLNFKPRDAIVWRKNNFGLGTGYRGQYEVCFYKGTFKGSDSDVWDEAKDAQYDHPTQKPVALAKRAILNSQPDTVLDLFLGSGSTLLACEQMGRKCYGIEIDPIYIDVILNRWAKYTGLDPVREDGVTWSSLQQE